MTASLTNSDNRLLSKYIEAYLKHRPPFYSFIRPQEALFFHKHQHSLNSPILDFGCGDGFFANQVFKQSSIDIGLDLNSSRIKEAEQYQVYKQLVTYDGNKIPFPNNHFGSIISNCVFEHLPNLDQNLSEMYRVLQPGGRLLTTIMTDKWEVYLIGSKIIGNSYLKYLRRQQDHYNLLSFADWQTVFKSIGFKISKNQGYLSPKLVKYNEITHYLSFPTLISYRLTGNWIPINNWHRPFHLTSRIHPLVLNDYQSDTQTAAAICFVLSK